MSLPLWSFIIGVGERNEVMFVLFKKNINIYQWEKKKNKGSILLISLFILSVILGAGLLFSDIIINLIASHRGFKSSKYAYYAADSGLKKIIFLLNNKIYKNYSGENFYLSNIDLCPSSWDEVGQNCPCPVIPGDNIFCAVDSSQDPVLISEGSLNNASYKVYLKIIYNVPGDNLKGLNRTIFLTAVGRYGKVEKKLEYSTCIGKFCK